jgi:hypothetical protein
MAVIADREYGKAACGVIGNKSIFACFIYGNVTRGLAAG